MRTPLNRIASTISAPNSKPHYLKSFLPISRKEGLVFFSCGYFHRQDSILLIRISHLTRLSLDDIIQLSESILLNESAEVDFKNSIYPHIVFTFHLCLQWCLFFGGKVSSVYYVREKFFILMIFVTHAWLFVCGTQVDYNTHVAKNHEPNTKSSDYWNDWRKKFFSITNECNWY